MQPLTLLFSSSRFRYVDSFFSGEEKNVWVLNRFPLDTVQRECIQAIFNHVGHICRDHSSWFTSFWQIRHLRCLSATNRSIQPHFLLKPWINCSVDPLLYHIKRKNNNFNHVDYLNNCATRFIRQKSTIVKRFEQWREICSLERFCFTNTLWNILKE